MAWTAPRTFVTSETVTSTIMNVHVRDNLKALRTTIDYVQITADVLITATSEGTANTVITGTSQAYDGTANYVEFFSPYVSFGGVVNLFFVCLRGATVIGQARVDQSYGQMVAVTVKDTPSASTFSYVVKAFNASASTNSVGAGTGTSGNLMPACLRVSSAVTT